MPHELKLCNSIATHALIFGIIKKIVIQIKEQGHENFVDMKLDPELVISCLKLVNSIFESDHTLTKKQKKQIDKKQIIMQALTQCFNLTVEESGFIDKQLTFIIDNGLIKNSFRSFIKSIRNDRWF
jgi:hypothetical protein